MWVSTYDYVNGLKFNWVDEGIKIKKRLEEYVEPKEIVFQVRINKRYKNSLIFIDEIYIEHGIDTMDAIIKKGAKFKADDKLVMARVVFKKRSFAKDFILTIKNNKKLTATNWINLMLEMNYNSEMKF